MSTVAKLLDEQDLNVQTIPASASVAEAIDRMNAHDVGAVLVTEEEDRLCGILTERDVLQRVVGAAGDLDGVPVRDWMSRDVICCTPQMTLEDVGALMNRHRVRNLPVVDEDRKSLGLVSMQDVNRFLAHDREVELTYLKEYLYGRQ